MKGDSEIIIVDTVNKVNTLTTLTTNSNNQIHLFCGENSAPKLNKFGGLN